MTTYEQQIANLLTPYANELEDERLGMFLSLSVGRIMLKRNVVNISKNDLRHITDWLKVSIINNEKWISNLDNDNRPKKLMKFSTIDNIVAEANKAMTITNQKLSGIKIADGDEELFQQLEGGYYLVKMLTPAALDRESSQMQHCIGQGGYDEELESPDMQYLSLRDAAGNAHVTLEIENNNIIQLQGKQNKIPNMKYLEILLPVFIGNNFKTDKLDEFEFIINYEDRKWYNIYELPEGFTVNQNLEYSTSGSKKLKLPKNLTINGNLNIEYLNINELPEGLHISGSLYAEETKIKELPHDIYVGEKIDLSATPIEHYAPGANTPNSINLHNCYKLKSLADNLHITDRLGLGGTTSLKKLPKNLFVGHTLDLQESGVLELPKDLNVLKNLYIEHTEIKEIPDNLSTCANILAMDSALENISDEITNIKNLNVSNCSQLKKLPDNLKVRSVLNIWDSQIDVLPENIEFLTIMIKHGQLKQLPEKLNSNATLQVLSDEGTKLYTPESYRKKLAEDNNFTPLMK